MKRRRKLIVDEQKAISGEDMKAQLASAGDTTSALDLAPPTKKLMCWKETGTSDKMFNLANYEFSLSSKILQKVRVKQNFLLRPKYWKYLKNLH